MQCAAKWVDIVDFHHYAMGDESLPSNEALAQTAGYGYQVDEARRLIQQVLAGTQYKDRASQIQIEIGEMNWSWKPDDRFYTAVVTAWGASAFGHAIWAGGIPHAYADQNGPLGLTFEKEPDVSAYNPQGHIGDPMPLFWGMFMFSGGRYFRHCGSTLVQATSRDSDLDVFATTAPNNVVLVNKSDGARTIRVALAHLATSKVAVWQTNPGAPFKAPTRLKNPKLAGNVLTVALPGYSVTTVLIG
jgi:hypothetical protein